MAMILRLKVKNRIELLHSVICKLDNDEAEAHSGLYKLLEMLTVDASRMEEAAKAAPAVIKTVSKVVNEHNASALIQLDMEIAAVQAHLDQLNAQQQSALDEAETLRNRTRKLSHELVDLLDQGAAVQCEFRATESDVEDDDQTPF